MLRFVFTDTDDIICEYTNPLSAVINIDENIPADDLTAVFPLIKDAGEFVFVSVYDGEKLVFKGIVDEQQRVSGEKNYYTKITARSMAAMLLDNESRPVNYTNVSASVIFDRHLSPNLITSYKGGDITLRDKLDVTKGMTDWQVFYTFAIKAFNKIPRINCDGTASFTGVESGDSLYFSNDDGIKYNSIKENSKRCRLISDVIVKAGAGGGYDIIINNKDIKNRKVNRRRFLDASVNNDLKTADVIIENSLKNSYELTLTTPGRILDKLGAKVSIDDKYLGKFNGLYISSVYYRLTPDKEETTLILKKEREYVDS